jgi:hypothetical protein
MIDIMAATINTAQVAQSEFSATCPRFEVVRTAYQEQTSAVTMRGTSTSDTIVATVLPVDLAVAFSRRAH